MELRESAQNYLESIYVISKRQDVVRATDICAYFGYSRPTVSVALKHFREAGLIHVDANNHITLTEEGLAVATSMYERHTLLTKLLVTMGVPKEIAVEDAMYFYAPELSQGVWINRNRTYSTTIGCHRFYL